MTTDSPELSLMARIARIVAIACLGYWALCALVLPVTNVDAQMYNLARLELAMRGGLFDNGHFTSVYHVMMPWTFDAVHLPFMMLGWGYALPSYLCLLGTCVVAFLMLRARFGKEAAWAGVLGLLSLTCLVYQGSTTKNDIPILFAGAVWVYARWRWRREGRAGHVVWMVLALGFMAGSKTTGVPYACILGVWALWETRRTARLLVKVAAGLMLSAFLFGSVETYVESTRIFDKPLGPDRFVALLKNRDGFAGGVANLTRHVARGVYVGPTHFHGTQPVAAWLSEVERALLVSVGLENKGNAPQFLDEDLYLHQAGIEEFSGYGPIGMAALVALLMAGVVWRPRTLWWRLAIGALAGLLLVSFAVAYNDWANRYLISVYALATLAVVCFLWENTGRGVAKFRTMFVVLAALSAVAAPLLSFNRDPSALRDAVMNRERLETQAFPIIGEVRTRLRELQAAAPGSRVYFVVCDDSVILPILRDRSLGALLVTPLVFRKLVATGTVAVGDLVVEDCPSGSPRLEPIAEVSASDVYSENATRRKVIYRVTEN